MKTITNHFFLILIFLIIASNQVWFSAVYPMNVGAYDYPNYLKMIAESESNLIHASGYSFVVRMVLDTFGVEIPSDIFNTRWIGSIQKIQLTLSLIIMFTCTLIFSFKFGQLAAALMVVFWGGNVLYLSGVNVAGPEWLQGELLALSLLLCVVAFDAEKISKTAFYTLSSLALTFSYLVKYNSLIFISGFLLLLIADRSPILTKFRNILIAGLSSSLLVWSFVFFHHQPTTGASQLSYDHAWVLTASIEDGYFRKDPETLGINSLRWRALSAVVPPEYHHAGAFPNLKWGAPQEIRDQFRDVFVKTMALEKDELIDFVSKIKLPEEFQEELSSIPLYYYFGLPITDSLGIAVYKEALSSLPSDYFKRVLQGFRDFLLNNRHQIVPFFSETLGLKMLENENGVTRYSTESQTPQFMPYWNPEKYVMTVGVNYFEFLNSVGLPSWLVLAFILLVVTRSFFVKNYRLKVFAAAIAASVTLYITASSLLLGYRSKEAIAVLPAVSILFSLGIALVFSRRNQKTLVEANQP